MLRATVGLSRKITRDYNSTGYSVNIDSEIVANPENQSTILDQIRSLWSLAQKALAAEMDRDQSEQATGRRDEEPKNQNDKPNGDSAQQPNSQRKGQAGNGNGHQSAPQAATNKQVQYVLSLGKRLKLSKVGLEERIKQVLGEHKGVYDLTKREAGAVIDALTQETPSRS